MTQTFASRSFALALLVAASFPAISRQWERHHLHHRLDRFSVDAPFRAGFAAGDTRSETASSSDPGGDLLLDPALLVRVAELGPLLASWQTIGGCGAGSGTGAGAGVKWIGRSVHGGLFNVQTQGTYTRIHAGEVVEHNYLVNTLITHDLSEKWVVGANIPVLYKYYSDYFSPDAFAPGIDVSNGGLGDVSLQLTRKLGPINATTLTALVGIPTGTYEARHRGKLLLQQRQLGFGKLTGTLILDHTIDQIWGVVVVGGLASWRGGQNKLDNYRSPNATTYAYTGYFLGPFVPALGLSTTVFKDHDRDQTLEQTSPRFSVAGNVSVEWSTDWIALLAAASLPYQYDGFREIGGM
ncbi:MAG: hypothetical protein ABI560_11965, partial [Myxococcales bacterium]